MPRHIPRHNIYRVNADGTGSWAETVYGAKTPEQALATAYDRSSSVVPLTATYIVVDPERNPNTLDGGDGQIVFTLQQGAQAVPVSLGPML